MSPVNDMNSDNEEEEKHFEFNVRNERRDNLNNANNMVIESAKQQLLDASQSHLENSSDIEIQTVNMLAVLPM